MQNKNGFTLIEIVTVMIIVGILSTISVSAYSSYIQQGEINSAQNTLQSLELFQQTYYFNNGNYCISNCDNTVNVNTNLKTNISDNYYTYSCNNTHFSYGYCCTATNNSNGDVIYNLSDGAMACGGNNINNSNGSTTSKGC